MVSLDGRYQDTMNYHIKEGIPSFDIADFDFDVNYKTETAASNQWDWESEKVINGDVAVIPSCSEVASMEYAANSPPASVDYYKMGGDWHQLVNMEMLEIENNPLEHEEKLTNMFPDFIMENDLTISPTAQYLTSPKKPIVSSGKKIDMNAKCYITDNNQRVSPKVQFSSDSEDDSDDENDSDKSDTESSSSSSRSTSCSSSSDMQSSQSLPEENQQNLNIKIELDNQSEENLENDFVDVDGISNDDLVLLAGDVDSLLEQFEATSELPKLEETNSTFENQDSFQIIKSEAPQQTIKSETPQQIIKSEAPQQIIKSEVPQKITKSEVPQKITKSEAPQQMIKNEMTQQIIKSEMPQLPFKGENSPKTHPIMKSPGEVNTQVTNKLDNHQNENEKSKQILDSLPLELIKKIQSNKRKMVPVIDPVPNKKRAVINKKQPEATITSQQSVCETVKKQPHCYAIKLDHTYCTTNRKIEEYKRIEQASAASYPKHPNKDSGFQSSEEDNNTQISHLNPVTTINERSILKSNILRRQMNSANVNIVSGLSMLKSKNTAAIKNSVCLVTPAESKNSVSPSIQSSLVKEAHKKKRKLNLDEYKKRRELPRSGGSSQNDSPDNSGSCSPTAAKDEQERYQQRLMEMAAEVLRATPKGATPTATFVAPVVYKPEPPAPAVAALQSVAVVPPTLPPHLEKKELVSIGVNTDGAGLTWKHLHVPLRELEEIRPILENASDKISNNSLIASVIENVQNKKIKGRLDECNKKVTAGIDHGEDKIIMWPEKNRPKAPTKDACVQTEAVLETTTEVVDFKRNRSSCSSSSSENRKRSSSRDSRYSYTSQSSSYSYTSSRSRSPSPKYRRRHENDDEERIREVYERRIVYVGGISSSITKETLRRRFQKFGQITKVSVHFPDHRDNYGFVTYANKKDAYKAVEHGNDDPSIPRYDLNFGGRRIFCRTEYADLDNVGDDASYSPAQNVSFDSLLREAQAKLRKRKST